MKGEAMISQEMPLNNLRGGTKSLLWTLKRIIQTPT